MEVRAKKALGQHFLTDQTIAKRIVATLAVDLTASTPAGSISQNFASLIPPTPNGAGPSRSHGHGRPWFCETPPSSDAAVKSDDGLRSEATQGVSGGTPPVPLGAAAEQRGLEVADVGTASRNNVSGGTPPVPLGAAAEQRGLEVLKGPISRTSVLEIGPGMGVLTQYLLQREDIDLKAVEVDGESVDYLLTHFSGMQGKLLQADYLRLDMHRVFHGPYRVIGNFPYNISSQIFFKILDDKDRVPEVVCMIQKEVAERIAEKPGSKTYGILSVLLQAWYDIEYCFTVGPGAFAPPPKVQSAVIRLTRNGRTDLGCDEKLFKTVVKTAFNQRRKTLRNALKPLLSDCQPLNDADLVKDDQVSIANLLELRAERLSVEDFVRLTRYIAGEE